MQLQLVFASAVLALSVSTHQVAAYAKYAKLLPNGAAVPDASAVGHPDAAGAEGVNAFGKAFKAAGNAWTKALCMADTDGDGFTNGQELGDPCCTWTPTAAGSLITDGISHPSDKTKTPSNAELIAGCSTTGAAATAPAVTTAPAKNATTTKPAATTAKPKETVSDVLAPVSATKSPSASKSTDIDDFASSESGSSASVTTTTKAPTKSVSSNSTTNTTSAAMAATKVASGSIAATLALVCISALAAAL